GDGAAVDVDPVVGHAEYAHVLQHHRGEGFVELEQVDVTHLHAGVAQRFQAGRGRPGEHDGRLGTDGGEGTDARARLEAQHGTNFLAANQHSGSAIDDAAGVAGSMDVANGIDIRITLQGNRII